VTANSGSSTPYDAYIMTMVMQKSPNHGLKTQLKMLIIFCWLMSVCFVLCVKKGANSLAGFAAKYIKSTNGIWVKILLAALSCQDTLN